ncbi:acyltransferase, putative [Bodo saltans]|uniref:Acyltransferase, putative n=1 Tax=Bodo saltans TaxID=75058 RepID=A0A0S4JG21_BODSA|nr:acyltransferase, putative [Bodo saltans]|eukprot:CUG88901.1 acyltransferase, putative [Bodo saltans]
MFAQGCVLVCALLLLLTSHLASAQLYPVNGQVPLDGVCAQSPAQLYMSGSFDKITLALSLLAFGNLYDLGSYDLCSMSHDTHYCTTYFGVMCVRDDGSEESIPHGNTCNMGPVLGICVPQECNGSVLSAQVMNYTQHAELFQVAFGVGTLCASAMPSYCSNKSYGFMSADCMDEQKSFTSDSSAVAVFAVIVAFCGTSILCGIAGVYRRWSLAMKSREESSIETERLLPVAEEKVQINDAPSNKSKNVAAAAVTVKQSKLWEVVGWFDLVENARGFFNVKSRNVANVDTKFFDGVRTIAFIFVVYGHCVYFPAQLNFYNPNETAAFLESYASIGIFPAELAVDTFFYLSGFLMFHLYIAVGEKLAGNVGNAKQPPISHIPMMYLRRYLRMTPVMMLTMVFAVWLSVYIPSGVLHRAYHNLPMLQTCKQYWWHQMLYISNMNDAAGWSECMGWFWYLSADFQMFLAAPLLGVVYFIHSRAFVALMGAGIVIITGLQTQQKYAAFLGDGTSFYDKTWMRANPYFFGLACAALVRFPQVRDIFSRSSARWLSYGVGTVLMVSAASMMWLGMKCTLEKVYQGSSYSCPTNFESFMNAYAVSAWGLGMSCLALPWSISAEMGPMKWFLSTKPFAIASKLTFCGYMLHPVIIMILVTDGIQNALFTPLIQYSRFCAAILITFFSATLLHLVVEVPFAKMNDAVTR